MTPPEGLRRRRLKSLRSRLLAALLVPMAVVMLVSLPWDFELAAAPSLQAYDELLATDAQALADQVHWEQGRPVLDLDVQAEQFLRANGEDEEYFVVRDAEGRRLAGDARLLPAVVPPGPRAVFSDVQVPSPEGSAMGPLRAMRMVTLQRGQGDAAVVVAVAETLNKRRAAENRVLAAMFLPNLLVALLGVGLIYFATRLSLAPLEQLAHQVSERSPDDLRPVVLDDRPLELDAMVHSLNRLFDRVRHAAERQHRFHANVAHQLRTPLAGLRAQVELAHEDGLFERDSARLDGILSGVDRLSHLVDQLLALSRAEAGTARWLTRSSVNVRGLVEARASTLLDRALSRHMDLGFELADTSPVDGIADLVGEMLENLVDNALRHCPPGTSVTVACGDREGRPWLAVEDDGPGIPAAQRSHLFHRFQRGSAAEAEGSGLGLAIVQEIADNHGAQVMAAPGRHGRGCRFEVRWTG